MSSAEHFLDWPVRSAAPWIVWFVCTGGALALGGFLALLARSYGLL